MSNIVTKEELINSPSFSSIPHVVILGAGASKAAFSNGDKNGKSIPLQDDLPKIIGEDWSELVKKVCPGIVGFENQFSIIRKKSIFSDELLKVEKTIEEYFENLEIPDYPTIYDYLVLGLRGKDVIASFNWDPFLILAHRRNREIADLPDIRFLHGCVAYATCHNHDVLGIPSEICPVCDEALIRSQLIFPEEDKDYTKDKLIHRDWQKVSNRLEKAFHLTIFGYSGPATDFNAKKLILDGWKKTPLYDFSHVEIIDISDEDNLRVYWEDFFPFYHDMITNDFWDSTIALYPAERLNINYLLHSRENHQNHMAHFILIHYRNFKIGLPR